MASVLLADPPISDTADSQRPGAAIASPSRVGQLKLNMIDESIKMLGRSARALALAADTSTHHGTELARPARVCCNRRSRAPGRAPSHAAQLRAEPVQGDSRCRTNSLVAPKFLGIPAFEWL